MADCSIDPNTVEDAYSCKVQLRPQDEAYKATFLKIATMCSIGIVVLFSYILLEKGAMGTQAIPTAAIMFLAIMVIVYQMYYSASEQNQIMPNIDPVYYKNNKRTLINIVNIVIGVIGAIIVLMIIIVYIADRKNSDVNGINIIPTNIFEIGSRLISGISTIPVLFSSINYNIENNLIIPEIWKANGVSKLRGKDPIPNSRQIHYNFLLTKGILISLGYSIGFVLFILFVVLKPFKDDSVKKNFVVALCISAVCYIQTVIVHNERKKLLDEIERDISTQKIFTESNSVINIQSDMSKTQSDVNEAVKNKVYDPIIKGVDEAGNALSQGGGGREGFQNFKPQYTSLEDFKKWYRNVREDNDVINEWRGKGNCQGLCANIDADLEAYEREETNKKKNNPDYVFGSHEDDETRLKDLQARILYKYDMIDFIKKMPEATAGKTDIRNWFKKFKIKNFEKNPALPACPEGETDTSKLCHRSFVETNNDKATKEVSDTLAKIDKGVLDTVIENNPCNVHTIKAQYGYTEPAPEDC